MKEVHMHNDEEIKTWVKQHLAYLIDTYCLPGEKEFNAEIGITDHEGVEHYYTVFLEYADSKSGGWVVRNIVRPEQLQ